MKGDLGTLRKVCRYAATVMAAGEIVLAACITITVILGIASMASDSFNEALEPFYAVFGDLEGFRFAETVFILLLGSVTVDSIRRMMVTLRDSHTPFTEGIASSMKAVSLVYLVSSFVLLALEIAAGSTVTEALFIFLGTLLVCVVMYCLSIVFRYGAVLQDESDHTL